MADSKDPRLELILASIVEAADAAGIGLVVTSDDPDSAPVADRHILYVSGAAARLLGRSREELLALAPTEVIAPDEAQHIQVVTNEVLRDQPEAILIETAIRRPDGARVPISAASSLVPMQGRRVAVTFFTDLSERDRALDALRRSEAEFRRLIENAPAPIWILDRQGLVFANLAAGRLFGFDSPDEALGKSPRDFSHPEDVPMLEKRARAMLRHGARLPPFEYRARRKDGAWMTVETSSIAIQYEGRKAVLSFGRDVTERKRLEGQLLQADRLATLGMLAGGMAHAINNPLTYVLLNLDQLERTIPELLGSPGLVADAVRLVSEAHTSAARVADLVRRMRRFARAEEQATVTSARDALESAIAIVGNEIRHRGRLVTEICDTPLVVAPPARLEQAFLNLLLHAAQSLPDVGGHDHEVRIVLGAREGRVVVEVAHPDAGGSADRDAESVDREQSSIGVSVCRDLVTQLGGALDVDRKAGRAVHRIWLPTAEWAQRAPSPSSPPLE